MRMPRRASLVLMWAGGPRTPVALGPACPGPGRPTWETGELSLEGLVRRRGEDK